MNGGFNGGTICLRRPYNRVNYGVWFTTIQESFTKRGTFAPGAANHTFFLTHPVFISINKINETMSEILNM